MVDTIRTKVDLLNNLFQDGQSDGSITANDVRDLIVSQTSILQGEITHDGLSDFIANEHINHSTVSITTSGGLAGGGTIEATRDIRLADVPQDTVIGRVAIGVGAPTNLTSTQILTMIGVEVGATSDQTGVEIKTAYELNANTNAYTDAEVTKVSNLTNTNTGDITLSGVPNYLTLSGQQITVTKLDITDDTNLIAGTGITLATNTLNVDAAQSQITSVGILTSLQVDNININGNTISSTAITDLLITPLLGQQLILDNTIIIDAGVVTGATSITSNFFVGALTGNADTVTTNANLVGDVASVGNITTIANSAVTYPKIQNLSGNNLILGRITAGAGIVEELTATNIRTIINVSDGADVTNTTSVNAAGATMNTDTTLVGNAYFIDDDAFTANDAAKIASQQSIKAYVDASVVSQVTYQGGYNATTNVPNLDAASPIATSVGDMYTVTVGGTFFTTLVEIGDVLIAEKGTAILEGDWTIVNKNLDAVSIKSSYESNANTNAYTDAEVNKVSNLSNTNTGDITLAGVPNYLTLAGQQVTVTKLDITDDTNLIAGTGITLSTNTLTVNPAQSQITSVGTLTSLQVDNININGNTISSTAITDLLITPLAGQQLILDTLIIIDNGVITGATSITSNFFVGALTGQADTVTTNANLTGDVTSVGNTTTIAVDAVNIPMLSATGTANATTFLRGDNTWSTVPGGVGDMVLADIQTITGAKTFNTGTLIFDGFTSGNITLNAPTVAGTNTLTLPAAIDTLVGKTTTDTFTNKTIDANAVGNSITNIDLAADVIGNLPVTNLNSGTSASAATFWRGDSTWATPAGSGDMSLAAVQTITGAKTFNTGTFILDGAISGQITINAAGVAGTGAWTVPLVTTDTFVGKATTDILTNKTIDANTGGNSITNINMIDTNLIAGTGITLATNTLSVDAAQSQITSVGILTSLQVDNININGNTISSTGITDLLITPLLGQQLILDNTIIIDAGVVTGATSITSNFFVGALTGNADTVTTNANLTGDVTSVGNATTIAVDAVDIPMLSATGVASGTTFLRGDNAWATPAGSGDMVLADIQTITGAKTFNSSTLKLAGLTSGAITVNATAVAGVGILTLPVATDTLVGKATVDTFTNKTIDANGIGNSITNIDLAADVIGNLPVANLNSGTAASGTTFWRGDGTWVTVTSADPNFVSQSTPTIAPVAVGINSIAIGNSAQATLIGQHATTSDNISTAGDSQFSRFVCMGTTTTATPVNLNPDNQATNRMILTDDRLWAFEILVSARENATGDAKVIKLTGAIKRGTGVGSTAIIGNVAKSDIAEDTNGATWTADVTADATLGALQLAASGQAVKTIKWTATVSITEIQG